MHSVSLRSLISLIQMVVWSLICAGLHGCFSDLPIEVNQDHSGSHLTKQQEIEGPIVRYLPQAHPFPLAPFPNDGATRYDPMSPTLRRLNLSVLENIEEGRKIRASLNQLEGFGVLCCRRKEEVTSALWS